MFHRFSRWLRPVVSPALLIEIVLDQLLADRSAHRLTRGRWSGTREAGSPDQTTIVAAEVRCVLDGELLRKWFASLKFKVHSLGNICNDNGLTRNPFSTWVCRLTSTKKKHPPSKKPRRSIYRSLRRWRCAESRGLAGLAARPPGAS